MNRRNDRGINQAKHARDRGDIALDEMFAAANTGMLAAIRQGLDLDGGLTRIIGAPPWLEMHIPELPSENGESPAGSGRLF